MSTGGRSRGAARQLAAVVRDGGARASTSGRAGPDERSPVHHLLGKIWALGARRRRSGPGSGGTRRRPAARRRPRQTRGRAPRAAPRPAGHPAPQIPRRRSPRRRPQMAHPSSLDRDHRDVDGPTRGDAHRAGREKGGDHARARLLRRRRARPQRRKHGRRGPRAAPLEVARQRRVEHLDQIPSRQGVWVLADRIQPPPNNGGRSGEPPSSTTFADGERFEPTARRRCSRRGRLAGAAPV